jgi:hypothetical protein
VAPLLHVRGIVRVAVGAAESPIVPMQFHPSGEMRLNVYFPAIASAVIVAEIGLPSVSVPEPPVCIGAVQAESATRQSSALKRITILKSHLLLNFVLSMCAPSHIVTFGGQDQAYFWLLIGCQRQTNKAPSISANAVLRCQQPWVAMTIKGTLKNEARSYLKPRNCVSKPVG